MDRKYSGEQILDALSEVGIGAGDISEVMGYLGRMSLAELNNNSTELDRENDDLISRQDVLALAKDVILINGAKHRCVDATQIHELPSVQTERKRGKWIYNPYYVCYECSECGEQVLEEFTVNPRTLDRDYDEVLSEYCPHCGSRMLEVENEDEEDEEEDD